jgi:hypothetical protein
MSSNFAFRIAIENGLLSDNPTASNYAGLYMFMGVSDSGTLNEALLFKNINTREYIKL